jgi:hypothetical protein
VGVGRATPTSRGSILSLSSPPHSQCLQTPSHHTLGLKGHFYGVPHSLKSKPFLPLSQSVVVYTGQEVHLSQALVVTSVILVSQEGEIRRIMVQSQPSK